MNSNSAETVKNLVVTVTVNPALDKTARVDRLHAGGLNRLKEVGIDAGGKGINVSRMIAMLGGNTIATGFAGGESGKALLAEITKQGVSHDFVEIHGATRVNLKVVDAAGTLTELNEPGPSVTEKEWHSMEQLLLRYAAPNTLFVLSGSLPVGVDADAYRRLIVLLHQSGSRVFLDVDGEPFRKALAAVPDYVKPNRYELLQLYRAQDTGDVQQLLPYCRELMEKGIRLVALSLGEDGAFFFYGDNVFSAPGLPVTVNSTVGAGDCMVGALAYAIQSDFPLEDALRLSIAASAGAVITHGTRPPEMAAIDMLLGKVQIKRV